MTEPAGSARKNTMRSILVAAAKRFVLLFAGVAAGTALVSLGLGLLFGSSVSRSLSVGFYVVGSFLLISGFFVGNRGPVRVKGDPGVAIFGFFRNRRLRWATGQEQLESLSLSVVFVALGVCLIVLGVVTDTRYTLI